jgi:hypothetical protein
LVTVEEMHRFLKLLHTKTFGITNILETFDSLYAEATPEEMRDVMIRVADTLSGEDQPEWDGFTKILDYLSEELTRPLLKASVESMRKMYNSERETLDQLITRWMLDERINPSNRLWVGHLVGIHLFNLNLGLQILITGLELHLKDLENQTQLKVVKTQ